jgi:hypothetical protein
MATTLLTFLQETPLALWVSGSPSLLGYPTILTLHTVGLALLVGASVAVDLRLLGVARAMPLEALAPLFPIMWIGLAINTASGVLLFMADAVRKAGQPVFLIKLACIAGAVMVVLMMRGRVMRPSTTGPPAASTHPRALALASLVLWAGAIAAGRLVAYL